MPCKFGEDLIMKFKVIRKNFCVQLSVLKSIFHLGIYPNCNITAVAYISIQAFPFITFLSLYSYNLKSCSCRALLLFIRG